MNEGTSVVIGEGSDAAEGEGRRAEGKGRAAGEPAPPSVAGLAYALVCLTIAASVSCVIEAAYLFLRTPEMGSGVTLPVPIAALVAAVLNTAMVAEARKWSPRLVVQAFPLIVWTLTLVCLHLGPGGNMPVPPSGRGLLLLVGGLAVPVFWGQIRSFTRLAAAS